MQHSPLTAPYSPPIALIRTIILYEVVLLYCFRRNLLICVLHHFTSSSLVIAVVGFPPGHVGTGALPAYP